MNKEELKELIYEALEIPVIKDGDLKLPLNQVEIRNYDEKSRPYGRTQTRYTEYITEYNYVSENSLSKEEFLNLLKPYNPTGIIYEPIKKKLTFGDRRIYYRHILKTGMM